MCEWICCFVEGLIRKVTQPNIVARTEDLSCVDNYPVGFILGPINPGDYVLIVPKVTLEFLLGAARPTKMREHLTDISVRSTFGRNDLQDFFDIYPYDHCHTSVSTSPTRWLPLWLYLPDERGRYISYHNGLLLQWLPP
jgi:hypothetical protein